MNDLYSEILKAEEMSKSISDFTDEIVEDPTVRDNFLIEFVDEIIDTMDQKDIVRAYAQSLLSQLQDELENNREDYIVQECAECFPYVLERFGVKLDEENANL